MNASESLDQESVAALVLQLRCVCTRWGIKTCRWRFLGDCCAFCVSEHMNEYYTVNHKKVAIHLW